MTKRQIVIIIILLFILTSSFGFAASNHTVSVKLDAYARVSVTGSAAIYVTTDDFYNCTNIKDFTSDVQINLRSNKDCYVQISGANLDVNFPISYVQAKIDVSGEIYHPLSTTGVKAVTLGAKQNSIPYSVLFQLTNMQKLYFLPINNYETTINYTVVTTP